MKEVILFAPSIEYGSQEYSYIDAPAEMRDEIAQGCGTHGIIDVLVPDKIWWLNMAPACKIHDWMYFHGETQADKEISDRVFLNNMNRIIDAKGGIWRWLRKRIAKKYYYAVCIFGGVAFWSGKNKKEEEVKVNIT